MARFTPYAQAPILRPTMTWEAGNTARISAINDSGALRAAYYGGPYTSTGRVGIVTSTDGFNWTRATTNPVIGGGFGGEAADAARPCLVGPGTGGISGYRLYYQQGVNPTNIAVATSSDGVTFTYQSVVIAYNIAGPSGVDFGWNSASVYWDTANSKWLITAQGASGGGYDALFQSTDGLTSFTYVSTLTTLEGAIPAYNGRSFFVPRSGTQSGQIQDFYWILRNGYTNVYHAKATDATLQTWMVDENAVETLASVTTTASIPEPAPNGIGDTSLVEFKGKVFLYYTIYDNTNLIHRLGVSTFNGTMANLFMNTRPSGGGPSKVDDMTFSMVNFK